MLLDVTSVLLAGASGVGWEQRFYLSHDSVSIHLEMIGSRSGARRELRALAYYRADFVDVVGSDNHSGSRR